MLDSIMLPALNGNGMRIMNKEALKTWDALKEPAEKTCSNCKHSSRYTDIFCDDVVGPCGRGQGIPGFKDSWEWKRDE